MKYTQTQIELARQSLELNLRGGRVYLVLRRRSGDVRYISLFVMDKNGIPRHLDHDVAAVIGAKLDKDGRGVYTKGSGMDMGFWLVHKLSTIIFRDGYALTHVWI